MNKYVLYVVLSMLLLKACTLDELGDCFKSTGSMVWEEREVEGVYILKLYDNIDLYLYPDTTESLRLYGGKNLLPGILVKQTDSVLILRNDNACNWVRDFSKPLEAHLHIKGLKELHYSGQGNIQTMQALDTDRLQMFVDYGNGDIDLEIHTQNLVLNFASGTSDLVLRGSAGYLGVYAGAYGRLDTRDMHGTHVYINHSSINDLFVQAEKVLDVELNEIGNIYYVGNPQVTILKQTGSGKVKPLQ